MTTLAPLHEGEVTLVLEQADAARPKLVKAVMAVILGPAVLVTLLALPIALLFSLYLAAALFVGGLFIIAIGLGIGSLATKTIEARAVDVQLTNQRALTRRGERLEEVRWADVAQLSALRGGSADVTGDVVWLDLAAIVIDAAVDAHAEKQPITTSRYWNGAAGLALKTKSGGVMRVPLQSASTWGLRVVTALAQGKQPS